MSVASAFGNFERLGDSLMMSSAAEEKLWSNLRSTGYSSLDQQLGGLRPGELVVIASQFDWMLPALNRCTDVVTYPNVKDRALLFYSHRFDHLQVERG